MESARVEGACWLYYSANHIGEGQGGWDREGKEQGRSGARAIWWELARICARQRGASGAGEWGSRTR